MEILAIFLFLVLFGVGLLGLYATGRYIASLSSKEPLSKEKMRGLENAIITIVIFEVALFFLLAKVLEISPK